MTRETLATLLTGLGVMVAVWAIDNVPLADRTERPR